jgi:hypothetical protein
MEVVPTAAYLCLALTLLTNSEFTLIQNHLFVNSTSVKLSGMTASQISMITSAQSRSKTMEHHLKTISPMVFLTRTTIDQGFCLHSQQLGLDHPS